VRIFFLSLCLLFCGFVQAGDLRYCNMLWGNDFKPMVDPLFFNIETNAPIVTPLKIHTGGNSTILDTRANLFATGVLIWGHDRYWFQFPDGWFTDPSGLRMRITSTYEDAKVQIAGVRTVVTPQRRHTWGTVSCFWPGDKWTFSKDTWDRFQLEIDKTTAFPGVHTVQLPIKSAFEENKGDYDGHAGGGWKTYPSLMASMSSIDTSGVKIEIRASCAISSPSIDVDMKTINAQDAIAGVKKDVAARITCSAPANVQLEITGSDYVDGVKNKVNCGSGTCTLNFPSGKPDEKLTFNQADTQTIKIETLFKTNKITPGVFNGSAVLRMNVL